MKTGVAELHAIAAELFDRIGNLSERQQKAVWRAAKTRTESNRWWFDYRLAPIVAELIDERFKYGQKQEAPRDAAGAAVEPGRLKR